MKFLNTKKYVLGDEFDLNNEKNFGEYIEAHLINKRDVNKIQVIQPVLELKYNSRGKLIKVNEIYQEERYEIDFSEKNIQLDEIKKFTEHDVKVINQSNSTRDCYLGGDGESKFKLPYSSEIGVPFVNIGKIVKKQDQFNLLPFKELFLAYPLHSSLEDFLFLDYQDNYSPKIINKFKVLEHPYGKIDKTGSLEFEKVYLKFDPINKVNKEKLEFGEESILGKIGSPFWLQHPNIPRSPKSGKLMKFVLQLETYNNIKCIKNSIKLNDLRFDKNFDYMNFWGSGFLYVFIEPETNIIALIIQST